MKITVAFIIASFEGRRGAAAVQLEELEQRLRLQQSKLAELGRPPWWRPHQRYGRWRLRRDERHTFALRHEANTEAEAYAKAIVLVNAGRYDFAITLLRGKATQVREAGYAYIVVAPSHTSRGTLLRRAETLAAELERMADYLDQLRVAKAKSQT